MRAEALLIVPVAIGVIALTIWSSGRADRILQRWAERNGYRIEWAERRTFFRGPYFPCDKSQAVFRVSVDMGGGRSRSGYVRCGAPLVGTLCDCADVRWDRDPLERPGFPVVMK